MKAFVFSSVQEATQYTKKDKNKGYVLFSTVENIKALSQSIESNVILCSTSGEYTDKGFREGAITGFAYNKDECHIVELLYPPVKSLENLKASYNKVKSNKDAFLLLLCDGLSGMEESIITTLFFMDNHFKIIGGSAGDSLKFDETVIYIGGKKVHSVALFFNPQKRTEILKENIYVPSGKRLLVTDADPISRVVKKFNNAPASTEYARMLGVEEADLPNHFMNHPLGKIYEEDIFIASPMKVNSDKSITFYCQLMPNTFVHVLEPIDPINAIKNTLSAATIKPSFVFVINCILRSLKFQQEDLWKDIDRNITNFCSNTTGFISYGEQYYKNHSNQTMVMLLVE
ncbi:Uncharacterized conserved protein, contains FIST_N domain [Natronincola peptidivorans]|uniref:Uncharacterized conserved protein, contains FIST_N domain n=1 Tax=Natronincola peptidivorans TaxID=426128 RepID=A0A1I0AYZ9_9FIRM|nr:FIST N-terminal domain-containing protein [Natronincola peptidivorans]SES99605.1 Uncharacterized conserved protein, contains FIST_N domain [Natronincola peptidivorans]